MRKPADADWTARQSAGLHEQAARAGASMDIETVQDRVRFAWRLPLTAPGGFRSPAVP